MIITFCLLNFGKCENEIIYGEPDERNSTTDRKEWAFER